MLCYFIYLFLMQDQNAALMALALECPAAFSHTPCIAVLLPGAPSMDNTFWMDMKLHALALFSLSLSSSLSLSLSLPLSLSLSLFLSLSLSVSPCMKTLRDKM